MISDAVEEEHVTPEEKVHLFIVQNEASEFYSRQHGSCSTYQHI